MNRDREYQIVMRLLIIGWVTAVLGIVLALISLAGCSSKRVPVEKIPYESSSSLVEVVIVDGKKYIINQSGSPIIPHHEQFED